MIQVKNNTIEKEIEKKLTALFRNETHNQRLLTPDNRAKLAVRGCLASALVRGFEQSCPSRQHCVSILAIILLSFSKLLRLLLTSALQRRQSIYNLTMLLLYITVYIFQSILWKLTILQLFTYLNYQYKVNLYLCFIKCVLTLKVWIIFYSC